MKVDRVFAVTGSVVLTLAERKVVDAETPDGFVLTQTLCEATQLGARRGFGLREPVLQRHRRRAPYECRERDDQVQRFPKDCTDPKK